MLELPRLGAPFSSQAGIDVRAKTADGGVRRLGEVFFLPYYANAIIKKTGYL
jgi:hypothetical protein